MTNTLVVLEARRRTAKKQFVREMHLEIEKNKNCCVPMLMCQMSTEPSESELGQLPIIYQITKW